MNQTGHMAMANMGGPVGGGPIGQPINAGTPNNNAMTFTSDEIQKKLNTAIYEYLLYNKQYEAAKAILKSMPIERADDQIKHSPSQRQTNGIDMDIDSNGIQDRPKDLPAPQPFSSIDDSPFLLDWWCQFWEIYQGNRRKGNPNILSYVSTQRQAQKTRQQQVMGANMDPNAMRTGMAGFPGGMIKPGMDLQKRAMQNHMVNMSPAQIQQYRNSVANQNQVNQGNPMERQGSQMDVNGPRSNSPNSGDAPSPKRPRIDGNNMPLNQGRPGQPGQMPNNQVGPPSNLPPSTNPFEIPEETRKILHEKGLTEHEISLMDPDALRKMSAQPANVQAKSIEIYSAGIQAQMQLAMQRNNSNTNKGPLPQNANIAGPGGAPGAQSSPMSQAGVDGDFYPNGNRMVPPNGNAIATGQAGAPGATPNNGGNHALQDYQMQLMLLEQQNKKRLLMARQEQDSMTHPPGVPNPNPGMMESVNQMRNPMMMNGGPGGPMMRPPPSSHAMPGNPLTQQQLEMISRQGPMMQNGAGWQGGAPQPPQSQMMPGQQQQPGQGGPPGQQPNMTPRAGNMAPPPAPQAANAGGTQPSSPAQQPAPPTPSGGQNKAKPGGNKKNDNKNAKAGANKKGGAAAAAAAANEAPEAPPTPTPPPSAAPNNVANFQQNKNTSMTNGQSNQASQQNNVPNGQQQTNVVQPSQADMNPPFGDLSGNGDFNLDYTNPDSNDLLDNFDFDMFLNATGEDTGYGGLDATFGFGDGLEADATL